jgi:hypothetical protein
LLLPSLQRARCLGRNGSFARGGQCVDLRLQLGFS